MTGITVTRADGRLLAVKRAGARGPDRLRREAAVLASIDHPGLIQFVELTDTEPIELRTLFAGTDSWDRRPPRGDRAVVEGLAAVAAIVADLHDLDTTHRSLNPSHVITAADGRPVLCGLSDAAAADDDGRRTDLADLAALVDQLGEGADGDVGRRLRAIAAAARDGSLPARAVVSRLDDLHPPPVDRAYPRRRVLTLGAAAVVILATIASIAIGATTGPDPNAAVKEAPGTPSTTSVAQPRESSATSVARPTASSTTSDIGTTTPSTTSVAPPTAPSTTTTTAPAPTSTLGVDPAERDAEIAHGGRRYAVGRDGDLVVVGDWDCDGTDTPALLRPGGGTVAVFGSWPPHGESVEPVHVVTVVGAEALDFVAADGCDQLRVRTPRGSRLLVVPETP